MRRIPAIVALAMLAACAGPKAPPPPEAAITEPPAWRGTPAVADAEVDAAWWTSFGDPVLAKVVETAIAHNDDIAIAAARVAEARGQFRLAGAQRLPNLGAGAGISRDASINPGFGVPDTQTAGVGELQISYDVDLFGRLADSSAAAQAALLASATAQANVRLAVAASAAGGYIGLRALDARLAVLQDTLAARGEELRVARRRADSGYSSQLDLAQAEAAYRATEPLIPATQLAITRQEDGLSVLLGESPRAMERGAEFDALAIHVAPVMVPAMLLRRRPDIASAEARLSASDHALDAARDAFMPDLQLAALGGLIGSNLAPGSPFEYWSLGGSILAPIFSAGRLEAQQDIATARRDQAAFAYRKAALSAFQEVEDALAAVQRDEEQERALIAQREVLEHALKLASNRYRAGYSPYLDQLDAQRGLLSVRLAVIQARADRLTALVSLYRAMGGGWRPSINERKAQP